MVVEVEARIGDVKVVVVVVVVDEAKAREVAGEGKVALHCLPEALQPALEILHLVAN